MHSAAKVDDRGQVEFSDSWRIFPGNLADEEDATRDQLLRRGELPQEDVDPLFRSRIARRRANRRADSADRSGLVRVGWMTNGPPTPFPMTTVRVRAPELLHDAAHAFRGRDDFTSAVGSVNSAQIWRMMALARGLAAKRVGTCVWRAEGVIGADDAGQLTSLIDCSTPRSSSGDGRTMSNPVSSACAPRA